MLLILHFRWLKSSTHSFICFTYLFSFRSVRGKYQRYSAPTNQPGACHTKPGNLELWTSACVFHPPNCSKTTTLGSDSWGAGETNWNMSGDHWNQSLSSSNKRYIKTDKWKPETNVAQIIIIIKKIKACVLCFHYNRLVVKQTTAF